MYFGYTQFSLQDLKMVVQLEPTSDPKFQLTNNLLYPITEIKSWCWRKTAEQNYTL